MSKEKKGLKIFAIGSSIAALAGYLAGTLTAPKSGKEIRGDIKKASDQYRTGAEKELKDLNSELNKVIKEASTMGTELSRKAGNDLQTLVDKADNTNIKVREMLSALHDGEAEDQDLKRAIKNAKSALEHLKDYLDK